MKQTAAHRRNAVTASMRRAAHKKYKKVVKVRTRYAVHDETNQAKVGDTVRIGETRPLSKQKRWRLEEIISRAE